MSKKKRALTMTTDFHSFVIHANLSSEAKVFLATAPCRVGKEVDTLLFYVPRKDWTDLWYLLSITNLLGTIFMEESHWTNSVSFSVWVIYL